jgi:hypothetical protein
MGNIKTSVFSAGGEAPSRVQIVSFRDQLSSVLDRLDQDDIEDAERDALAAACGGEIVAILRATATVDLEAGEMRDLQALLDDRLPQLPIVSARDL